MKILLINKYSNLKGGAEKYCHNIQVGLEKMGHKVFFFSMTNPQKLRRHLFWSFSANRALQKIISEFQPDIVHLHNIYHDFSPSILYILKRNNLPTVMTLHDFKLICPNNKLFTNNKICEKCHQYRYYQCALNKCVKKSFWLSAAVMCEMYLHNFFLKSYLKNIDIFISPSQFLKDKFKEWGFSNKIILLSNFTNIKKNSFLKKDYLLYCGRLEPEKGLPILLSAMKKMPNEKLLVIGEGSIKKQNTKNVEFIGYQTDPASIIAAAKLLIVPSLLFENNSLSVIEAQALGTPVLASRIGGLPEMTKNLFAPGQIEDLIKKIQDPIINEKKIALTEQEHLDRLIKIYQSLL